jgi:two-component system, response regulator YesN
MGRKSSQQGLDMKAYRWEIGACLANQVQAGDERAAQKTLRQVWEMIVDGSAGKGFEEMRLRMVQVMAIANRGAYAGGADPDRLFGYVIEVLGKFARARNEARLMAVARKGVAELAAMVRAAARPNDAIARRAVEYIKQNCARIATRRDAARAMGCSVSHLSRALHRGTGRTFKQALLSARMERAKALLRDRGRRIVDVAFEAGYGDPNYFSYAFKREIGVTPSRYRRSAAAGPGRSRR